jgi:hypothetical protein
MNIDFGKSAQNLPSLQDHSSGQHRTDAGRFIEPHAHIIGLVPGRDQPVELQNLLLEDSGGQCQPRRNRSRNRRYRASGSCGGSVCKSAPPKANGDPRGRKVLPVLPGRLRQHAANAAANCIRRELRQRDASPPHRGSVSSPLCARGVPGLSLSSKWSPDRIDDGRSTFAVSRRSTPSTIKSN